MPDSTTARRYLRAATVRELLGGISTETLWRWCRDGLFPKPVRLNPKSRINVWPESQVTAAIANGLRRDPYHPTAAIAERARRRANKQREEMEALVRAIKRKGWKIKNPIGFVRGKGAPP